MNKYTFPTLALVALLCVGQVTAISAYAESATSTDATAAATVVKTKHKLTKHTAKKTHKDTTASVEKTDSKTTTQKDAAATSTKKSLVSKISTLFHSKKTTKTKSTSKAADTGSISALCNDGTTSHADHREGMCSSHGGVKTFN